MIRNFLKSLLPQFANSTLNPWLSWVVVLWVKWDENARYELESLQYLQKVIHAQALKPASPEVWARIQDHVSITPITYPAQSRRGFWQVWAVGMALIVLSFILFWFVLPPGIVLQWTTSGNKPVTFRIYRANSGQPQNFELLDEISASTNLTSLGARVFTYRDLFLLPGQTYEYRIEMIDPNGLAYSETIMSQAFQALPGQLALLISLLFVAYGISLALPNTKNLAFSIHQK